MVFSRYKFIQKNRLIWLGYVNNSYFIQIKCSHFPLKWRETGVVDLCASFIHLHAMFILIPLASIKGSKHQLHQKQGLEVEVKNQSRFHDKKLRLIGQGHCNFGMRRWEEYFTWSSCLGDEALESIIEEDHIKSVKWILHVAKIWRKVIILIIYKFLKAGFLSLRLWYLV